VLIGDTAKCWGRNIQPSPETEIKAYDFSISISNLSSCLVNEISLFAATKIPSKSQIIGNFGFLKI
jgi:hypothetical protein